MLRYILGNGNKYGGPVWDVGPDVSNVPASTWPKPTPENVNGIIDTLIAQLPDGVDPKHLSLRELAGMAIRPTFEDLPQETRDLVEEISPDFLDKP